MPFSNGNFTILKRQIERITSKKHPTFKTVEIGKFLLCLTVLDHEARASKRSLRSLRYRNGIPAISLETLSSVTQGKQRNAIVVTQTIPLARIVLSISEAYSWNK